MPCYKRGTYVKDQLVLYIGLARRGEFESLVRRGIPVGVILDKNNSLRLPDLSAFSVVEDCDLSESTEDILRAVDLIRKTWKIGCVLITHERYVLAGVAVTEHLGLLGLTKDVTLACLDKTLMHEQFVQHIGPQSTAKFKKIASREDLIDFAQSTNFPIILKPTNLYNSLFVSLSQSQEELQRNYQEMLEKLSAFFGQSARRHVEPCIQAEEFLSGSIYSIDCVVDTMGSIFTTPLVDMVSGKDIGWNDFHHFARITPSRLAVKEQEELYHLATAGVKALGIKSSIAHVELVQTKDGPRLLEIGARPGGNRSRIFDLSYGIDLMYIYYQVRLGQKPDVTPQKMIPTAVISPYSSKQGRLTKINYLDRIKSLKTHFYHEVKVSLGQPVGPSTQGYMAPLNIELCASNAEEVYQDLKEIQSWQDIFVVE